MLKLSQYQYIYPLTHINGSLLDYYRENFHVVLFYCAMLVLLLFCIAVWATLLAVATCFIRKHSNSNSKLSKNINVKQTNSFIKAVHNIIHRSLKKKHVQPKQVNLHVIRICSSHLQMFEKISDLLPHFSNSVTTRIAASHIEVFADMYRFHNRKNLYVMGVASHTTTQGHTQYCRQDTVDAPSSGVYSTSTVNIF